MKCYCGNSLTFAACCEPFLLGKTSPKTAEQLMRSRYSAFCSNLADYLLATHWPVEESSKANIQQTIDSTEWLGLNVIQSGAGSHNDEEGTVEFIAFFNEHGVKQLHERSHFRKIEERWFYIDGDPLPAVKLGRNDLCFCGSGKKYKKCHG